MSAATARVAVALDAMGGDHAPAEPVRGALAAAGPDLHVLLVGDEPVVRAEVARQAGAVPPWIEIVHAPEKVSSDEDGARAVRAKPDSSVALACRLVSDGRAQAAVSAGHTGAMLAAATLYMRRAPGVIRPAIAVVIPSVAGPVVLLDAGASAEARPDHYPQYAMMGRLFSRDVLGVPEPTVGLLSIGEEEGRGNEVVQAAFALLKDTPGFVGNVEGRDINRGVSDVVVTDGFTGNVVLKSLEGAAWYLMTEMRSEVTRTLPGRIGALLVRPSLRRMRARVDPENYGGAYLLGVRGLAVIAHGNSSGTGIANAVRAAARGAREDLVTHFAAALGAERAPSA